MTLTLPAPAPVPTRLVVDVVIPVHNEEHDLARCVERLYEHLGAEFPYGFRITIADNASTDATLTVARALAERWPDLRVVHLAEKGRGRALRAAWSTSDAPVVAYMDVDLSTDLRALLPLVAPLISGHSDIAIGTRLARGSRVVRGFKREAISRGYNLLLRGTLAARFSDAQCGFKALRREVADRLLPLIEDTGWFFDTELLVLAERAGMRIHEVPVDWVDDPDSRVEIWPTVVADLRGIARLIRSFATGRLPLARLRGTGHRTGLAQQFLRFCVVGVGSTLAFLGLFAALRLAAPPQVANVIALLTTAIANTAVNRRLTFGVVGRRHVWRHQLQGLLLFGLGLGLTSGALALVNGAALPVEIAVLVVANLVATVARFLALRFWLHHRRAVTATPS